MKPSEQTFLDSLKSVLSGATRRTDMALKLGAITYEVSAYKMTDNFFRVDVKIPTQTKSTKGVNSGQETAS